MIFQQMLLVHFEQNPKFLKGGAKITAEFREECITLQLETDQGLVSLDHEHMIGKSWKLRAVEDLTVRTVTVYTVHVEHQNALWHAAT